MLCSSLVEHGMTLSSVLGELGVNVMNKIVSDWGGENCWHWYTFATFFGAVAVVDRNYGP
jgi:hypothetical protein